MADKTRHGCVPLEFDENGESQPVNIRSYTHGSIALDSTSTVQVLGSGFADGKDACCAIKGGSINVAANEWKAIPREVFSLAFVVFKVEGQPTGAVSLKG